MARVRVRSVGAALVASALLALLPGLVAPSSADDASPRIGATIFPLFDIARTIAGPLADAVLILPPGASPHTFEPTPATVRALSGASILFVVGHGVDDWAGRVVGGAGVTRVVRVDEGITLRRVGTGATAAIDPHYWLTIANAKIIARTIAAELARTMPQHAMAMQDALAAYLARLDAADAEIRRRLAALSNRRIATFHDAFGYFAAAYGLEVVAVFEPFAGREPGPRFVMEFERKLRAADVRVVFSEPQLSVDVIRPIARDVGVRIAVLDPLGGAPGRTSYVDTMLFDAAQVVAASTNGTPRP